MKRLLLFLLFPLTAFAQTATLNDAVVVNSVVQPLGIVMTHSVSDQDQVLKNLAWSGGFEPIYYSLILQVASSPTGTGTVFASNDQFANYPANFFTNGTFKNIRQGATACSGTIVSQSGNDAVSPHLTTTISGGAINSVSIANSSLPGMANGTYTTRIASGGGTGGAVGFTVTGATLGGSGYTGGTIVSTTFTPGTGFSSAPAITILATFFTSSCGASGGYSVGDFVNVVINPIPSSTSDFTSTGWQSSLGGGATFIGETSDLSQTCNLAAGATNTQAGLLSTLGGGFGSITQNFDTTFGGKPQNYVSLSNTYTLTACLKLVSGSGNVNLSWGRVGTTMCTATVTPTTSWAPYTCVATPTDVSTPTNGFMTITPASNMSIEVDSVSLKEPTTSNTTIFRDAVVTTLKNAGIGSLRVLDNQYANTITSYLQPDTNTVVPTTFNEGAGYPGGQQPIIPLPPGLALSLFLGTDYWGIIPVAWGTSDATTLQQYLSDPCSASTTGSIIRCAQGQTTPWTTAFQSAGLHMHFEVGNENWNSAAAGMKWSYVSGLGSNEYTPYGYQSQTMFSTMKAYSTYNSTVERLILGAQTSGASSTFAMDSLVKSGTGIAPAADEIAQAPYTQFNANSFSTSLPRTQDTSALAEVYYNATNASSPEVIMANAGYPQNLVKYEFHNGLTNGAGGGVPSQTELNGWSDGEGYGIVNAVSYLNDCHYLHICQSQNLFTLGQLSQNFGNGSATVDNWIWGVVVGMGSVSNNNIRPSLTQMGTINACIPRNSSEFQITNSSVATWNFTASNGIPSITGIPEWYAYGYKSGTSRCVIIVNADPVNSYTITLAGTTLPSGTVTQNYYHSANLNDDNETTNNVVNVTTTPTFSNPVTVAAHSITAIGFTAGTGTVATPTFSPVAGTYGSAQTVTITTSTAGATLCYTTDGSTPLAATPGTCSHGTTYSTPVSVPSSLTVNAIGTLVGDTNSSVGTAAYVISAATSAVKVSGKVTISGKVVIN